ncbi:MAG: TIGR02281 family clan AA aspartic protease [Zoogloeaceae bacterium]|jgi:aspartyl protease family protein|nr:TIGR02281 family clan AA aspartic protease [Zoogloeaceae bacterium]
MMQAHGNRKGWYFTGALTLAALSAFSPPSALADVGLVGIVANKAIVSIDGAPPRILAPGQEHLGVKIISTQGETVTMLIDGKQRVMRIGQNAVAEINDVDASVTLIADSRGHFMSEGAINGVGIRFMVDTGATTVALGASDAKKLRLNLETAQRGYVDTANGQVVAFFLKLHTVRVGTIVLHNVDCSVNPKEDLPYALLGMSFLNRVNMTREGDNMTLKRRF